MVYSFRIPYYIHFHVSLRLLSLRTVSCTFSVFPDLNSLSCTGQVYSRFLHYETLADVLMVRLGWWVWGGGTYREVDCHFHHLLSKVLTIIKLYD